MDVTIVADEGTHLLITQGGKSAIVERRNNHLYNCHGGKRVGIPLSDLSAIAQILDEGDWIDKVAAQAAFNEVIARETQLVERML
jgi:hypothetical protein